MGLMGLTKKMAIAPASLPSLSTPCFSATSSSPSLRRRSSSSSSSSSGRFPLCKLSTSTKEQKEWRQFSSSFGHYWQSTRRISTIIVQAVENQGKVADEEISDNKILPYCSIDKKADKRSLGELEQDFLEALQSFYYDKEPIMSNEEFDNLKEELTWEGSSVVILSPDEQKFMEASLSYAAGKSNMSDAEFDALKLKLKKAGSKVAIEGPRCSLRSKKVYSDSTVDYLKMFLLNVPAAIIALFLVFFLDDLTGFEITYLLELPEPYSFIFTWFVVLPATFLTAQFLTNVILKDFLILKGPCPNCGATNSSFFGTILSIPSGGDSNLVKCEQCNSMLKFELESRLIILESTPSDKVDGPKTPKKAVPSAN